MKGYIYGILMVSLAVSFVACSSEAGGRGGTSAEISGVTTNEMTKRIVVNSVEVASGTNEKENDFFIAPLTYYSTLGNIKNEKEDEVNNDGTNYVVVPNLFDTYYNTLKLDFIYSSEDSRDNFNNTFGSWRTSFTSYMDFALDYDNANIKSNLYNTPLEACVNGFDDIKETLHRGILKDAYVSYDTTDNLCIVNGSNGKLGEFNIFSKTYGVMGDYHYVTKPSGQMLVFHKQDDSTYISNDRGVEVSMEINDGVYEYIDADAVKYTYNSDGKLTKFVNEGQSTTLEYDDRYKITKLVGPEDNNMTYHYDDEERLTGISFGGKEVKLSYNDNNLLSKINLITDEFVDEDDNESEEKEFSVSLDGNVTVDEETLNSALNLEFTYNDKELLSTFVNNDINISDTITYTYDEYNRVVKVQNGQGIQEITYEPTQVTVHSDDSDIVRNISYKNTKQQVQQTTTEDSELTSTYNTEAQLSAIELQEEPGVDENGSIKAQGLVDGKEVLKAQFTYNKKGLINNIQYNSVKSGNKFVKFDYKSKYPKPTKILTEDDVTFFDYNDDGALIKKTAVKFDKQMKLRANSVTKDEILSLNDRLEINYYYNKDGMIESVRNVVKNETTNYEISTNGKPQKQLRIRTQSLNLDFYSNIQSYSNFGWTSKTGYIKVDDENSHTAFVGGAGDGGKLHENVHGVYQNFNSNNPDSSFYTWDVVDPRFNGQKYDVLDNKGKNKLITIAHSWGGDSAMRANGDTDLLILVDPIGWYGAWTYPSAYVIELYATAGTPYGGYYTIQWKYQTKTFNFIYLKCSWSSGCRWKTIKKAIKVKVPTCKWHKTLSWKSSDWVAFFGGKGWNNSFDIKLFQDQFIKMNAHHEDFEYMLWKMEHGSDAKPNNNFGIMEALGNPNHSPVQSRYDKYPKIHLKGLFY